MRRAPAQPLQTSGAASRSCSRLICAGDTVSVISGCGGLIHGAETTRRGALSASRIEVFGCCLNSASSSSSTSLIMCANTSIPARRSRFASPGPWHAPPRACRCLWASSRIAPYRSGVSVLIVPPRVSTHILISGTLRCASSCTSARAPSTVVTTYAAWRMLVGLISSSGARPRPAVRNRAASGSLPARSSSLS